MKIYITERTPITPFLFKYPNLFFYDNEAMYEKILKDQKKMHFEKLNLIKKMKIVKISDVLFLMQLSLPRDATGLNNFNPIRFKLFS